MIDKAARQCGFDRAQLRRINMVPPEAIPVTNALGNTVYSGTFLRSGKCGHGQPNAASQQQYLSRKLAASQATFDRPNPITPKSLFN
jgi:hypothetical protein